MVEIRKRKQNLVRSSHTCNPVSRSLRYGRNFELNPTTGHYGAMTTAYGLIFAGEQSTQSLTMDSTINNNEMTSETAQTTPVTVATGDVVTSSTAALSAAVSTLNQLITSDVSSSLIPLGMLKLSCEITCLQDVDLLSGV